MGAAVLAIIALGGRVRISGAVRAIEGGVVGGVAMAAMAGSRWRGAPQPGAHPIQVNWPESDLQACKPLVLQRADPAAQARLVGAGLGGDQVLRPDPHDHRLSVIRGEWFRARVGPAQVEM